MKRAGVTFYAVIVVLAVLVDQLIKYAVEAFMPGGWSLQAVRELFRATAGTAIQPLGPKD